MALIWNAGNRNGTGRLGWLEDSPVLPMEAIKKLEAAAGVKGDWDYDSDTGWNWWGLHGLFDGHVFTVYTHKSGSIKIGGFAGLDVPALKAALLAIVSA